MLEVELQRVLGLLLPQNRLIMEVILHTGLRIGDVLALKTEQITTNFWITEAKTRKRRRVGLSRDLVYRIREQAGPVWAFPSSQKDGYPKTRQAVWADLKRAARACRLPQNIGTHSGRKVYAVELLRRYGDIDRVRRALNHSSTAVTMLYAMADSYLAADMAARTPPKRRGRGK